MMRPIFFFQYYPSEKYQQSCTIFFDKKKLTFSFSHGLDASTSLKIAENFAHQSNKFITTDIQHLLETSDWDSDDEEDSFSAPLLTKNHFQQTYEVSWEFSKEINLNEAILILNSVSHSNLLPQDVIKKFENNLFEEYPLEDRPSVSSLHSSAFPHFPDLLSKTKNPSDYSDKHIESKLSFTSFAFFASFLVSEQIKKQQAEEEKEVRFVNFLRRHR